MCRHSDENQVGQVPDLPCGCDNLLCMLARALAGVRPTTTRSDLCSKLRSRSAKLNVPPDAVNREYPSSRPNKYKLIAPQVIARHQLLQTKTPCPVKIEN